MEIKKWLRYSIYSMSKNKLHVEKRAFLLLSVILAFFIIIKVVYAETPNPGHSFSQIGTGLFQGDLLFGSDTDKVARLSKDTNSTRYLSNTGENNNPAWAQVSLEDGVSGNLSTNNLDSGSNADSSTFWRGDGKWERPTYKTLVGGGSSTSLTASAICNPFGHSVCNTNLTTMIGFAVPYDASISNLYGITQGAPASGSSCKFTVRRSESCTDPYQDTPLSCTVVGNGTKKTCSDTLSKYEVNAGDCLQIYYEENGTCSGLINWGFEIDLR